MYYFAYGSNMFRNKLELTVGGMVIDLGIATLAAHSIIFNKYRTRDHTGKTNIIASNNNVIGVVYDLTEEQFVRLDNSENGYHRQQINIELNNEIIETQTYVANENRIDNNLQPTREYRQFLIDGAIQHNFPIDYIQMLQFVQTTD